MHSRSPGFIVSPLPSDRIAVKNRAVCQSIDGDLALVSERSEEPTPKRQRKARLRSLEHGLQKLVGYGFTEQVFWRQSARSSHTAREAAHIVHDPLAKKRNSDF